eukprot:Pgem_evm1s20297
MVTEVENQNGYESESDGDITTIDNISTDPKKKRFSLKSLKRNSKSNYRRSQELLNEEKLREIDSKSLDQEPLLFLFSCRETFDVLKDFLEYEFNAENMEFVSAVLDYEIEPSEAKRIELAEEIFMTYIRFKSKYQVNLSDSQRSFVDQHKNSGSPTLFRDCKEEALKIMKLNSFPRFSNQVSALVHESWNRITAAFDSETVGNIFYEELFAAVPALKALFTRNTPHAQSTMFVSMVDNAITILDDLSQLIPKLATLSVRHRAYGCHTGQFFITGQVLVKVLKTAEGDNWNEDLQQAWVCVYTLIAAVMKQYLPGPIEEDGPGSKNCTLI